jgi:hypothetical protein
MKAMFNTLKATLGVAVLATLLAPLANAQCVSPGLFKRSSLIPQGLPWTSTLGAAAILPAAYERPAGLRGIQGSQMGFNPIVGFWKVDMASKGNDGIPDGAVLDSGLQQWHSDGTEIHNSGARPPVTQSFCLGVWEQTGPSHYKLNHFAISWNPDGTPLGLANIREDITLSRDHNTFSGTFTIDQYNTGGNLQVHLQGQITGKRITMSTTVNDLL